MTFNDTTKWFIIGSVGVFVSIIIGVTAAKEGFFDEDDAEDYVQNRDSDSTASGLTKRKRKNRTKSNKKRK
jgi:hypothetical protein